MHFRSESGAAGGGAVDEQDDGESGRGQGQAVLPHGFPAAVRHEVKFSQVYVASLYIIWMIENSEKILTTRSDLIKPEGRRTRLSPRLESVGADPRRWA